MSLRASRSFYFCLLFVIVFITAGRTAFACSCGPQPTVLDEYDSADVVIIARVVSYQKGKTINELKDSDENQRYYVDGVRSTTMIVEKVFKGKLKVRDEIVFGQGGGADCIWTFKPDWVGHEFLFYLKSPDKFAESPLGLDRGLWYAVTCGRSGGLQGSKDDLLYLENMSKVRGKTRISGTLGGWQNPDLDVAGKKIKIIGPKKTYEARTDKDGVFEIYDLPPGKYFIEPETPAGWKIDPTWVKYSPSVIRTERDELEMKSSKQVAIMLEPGKHAGVDLVFTIDNVVRGRVLGPKGQPLARVCVYMLAPGQDEGWGSHDCTNEKGQFEITSIPEGQYVLVANQDGKLSDREPFHRIYYPNVSDRDQAAVINIGPGDTINDLNIVVPKLEETITLRGVLKYSDGKPVAEKWVAFKATEAGKDIDGNVSEETDAAGRFSLKILKGLSGELSAEHWLMEGLYKNCPKVDELLAQSGKNNTEVLSNVIRIDATRNFYDLELTFPFPQCEKKE
jgi:hypothetical protein